MISKCGKKTFLLGKHELTLDEYEVEYVETSSQQQHSTVVDEGKQKTSHLLPRAVAAATKVDVEHSSPSNLRGGTNAANEEQMDEEMVLPESALECVIKAGTSPSILYFGALQEKCFCTQ